MTLPLKNIQSNFPIFSHHPNLIYLDNAATTQKPQAVIQAITNFYEKENASVHRGLYELSANATQAYEAVRKKVAGLIGAKYPRTIAFTKGTTESINVVAHGFLKNKLQAGDNVVITAMEHHANLIPWQQVCRQQGANLRIAPVNEAGELMMKALGSMLDDRTRLLAVAHISNVTGVINPIGEIISMAHLKNIPVLVDGAQSVGHVPIDVAETDIDFLVWSAHKMFGPLGTGVLYCKDKLAHHLAPLNYGGGNIRHVDFQQTEFLDYPALLEAGTPHIPGVIGLGAAIDFVQQLDINEVVAHERNLGNALREKLLAMGGIRLTGNPGNATGIVSFQVEGIHPHDVASFLANENIAVRAGHHCAQPLLEAMGIPATVRASFSIYNTMNEVESVLHTLDDLKKFWL